MTLVHRARAWLGRRAALLLLVATASGLAAGGLARLAGAGGGHRQQVEHDRGRRDHDRPERGQQARCQAFN